MKNIILFLSIFILYFLGCKNKGTEPINQDDKYPANLNFEWVYNTKNIIEYYDSSGHLQNPDTTDNGNTIVRIAAVNQTIGDYTNLILFESYDINTPGNIAKTWYQNSDSGLYAIAYFNAGASHVVIPKSNYKKYLTFDDIKFLGVLPSINLFKNQGIQDSILYYQIPRKVLAYPLSIGRKWVELYTPFYRERYIDKKTDVQFNGSQVECFCIESDWKDYNTEFTDYVGLKEGIVERVIISDSVAFSNANSPVPVSFGRITTISKLVSKNF